MTTMTQDQLDRQEDDLLEVLDFVWKKEGNSGYHYKKLLQFLTLFRDYRENSERYQVVKNGWFMSDGRPCIVQGRYEDGKFIESCMTPPYHEDWDAAIDRHRANYVEPKK